MMHRQLFRRLRKSIVFVGAINYNKRGWNRFSVIFQSFLGCTENSAELLKVPSAFTVQGPETRQNLQSSYSLAALRRIRARKNAYDQRTTICVGPSRSDRLLDNQAARTKLINQFTISQKELIGKCIGDSKETEKRQRQAEETAIRNGQRTWLEADGRKWQINYA